MIPARFGRIRAAIKQIGSYLKPKAKISEVKISVAQLVDLPNCGTKIGPLSGKKWYSLLDKYFELFSENAASPPNLPFKDLSDLLTYDLRSFSVGRLDHRKVIRRSLGEQFCYGFRKYVVEHSQLTQDFETGLGFTTLFMELARLSIVIKERRDNKQPFIDIIIKANQKLADTYCKPLPIQVKIV